MDLLIRKGTMEDVAEIGNLYNTLNDYLEGHINYPGWKKGIYPTDWDALEGIKENGLYVVIKEDRIVGSFILRHKPEKAYYEAHWKKELSYDKVLVIYTFAVHPFYAKQKIGTGILEFIEKTAKESGIESIRLDVYEGNKPAICLYEKNQFEYIDTVDLGLAEYGLKWFRLYEKIIA